MKVECILRMARLHYQVVERNNPRKASNNKLPFIRDGDAIVEDSSLIIDYIQKKYRLNFNRHLSPSQIAISQAFQIMLEDHLYWAALYARWIDAENWPKLEQHYFSTLPPGIRQIIAYFARKRLHREVYEHGLGRHDKATIYAFGIKDISALAVYLDGKDYFHGDSPSSIDATVFSYTGNILVSPFNSPMKECLREHDNLVAYTQRMYSCYFPELSEVAFPQNG